MAQFTINPISFTSDEVTFIPSADITIDLIENPYRLPLNFSEGDVIVANTELKFNIEYDSAKTPQAVVTYTEV